MSSSDGYCSIITFTADELGEVLCDKESKEEEKSIKSDESVAMDVDTPEKIENRKTEAEKTKESQSSPGKVEEKAIIRTPKHKSPKVKQVSAKKKAANELLAEKETIDIEKEDKTEKLKEIEKSKETLSTPGKNKDTIMKTPKLKSPKVKSSSAKKKGKNESTDSKPDSIIVMDEAAMEAWSQDGFMSKVKSPPIIKPQSQMVIDDPTQDMNLVYDETDDADKGSRNNSVASEREIPEIVTIEEDTMPLEPRRSPRKSEAPKSSVLSPKPQPKTPRRVNFITLSSPKSKKKLL